MMMFLQLAKWDMNFDVTDSNIAGLKWTVTNDDCWIWFYIRRQ